MRRMELSVLLMALMLGSVVNAADWPGFLGVNRDAVSLDAKPVQPWGKEGPKVLWEGKVGPGFGGAAIAEGKVYLLDRILGEKDVLRCLDLKTGKELWKYAYDAPGRNSFNGSRSTPTVGKKHVYTVGGFGDVYCIDKTTHKMVWKMNVNKKYTKGKNNWGIAQSPLLYGSTLIVSSTHKSTPGLIALNKDTGVVVWESENFGGDDYSSPTIRTVQGVEGVMLITGRQLFFVNPKTGKTIWHFDGYSVKFAIPMPTVLSDGKHIYLTGGYSAGSVMITVEKQGSEYKISEKFRLEEGAQLHPAIEYNGYLYVNTNENAFLRKSGRDKRGLACLDPKTGKFKWKTGAKPNFHRGHVLRVKDRLVALDGELGNLHIVAASPDGYKELCKAKVLSDRSKKIWGPMAISDGLLVIRSQKEIKCVDLRSTATE